MNTINWRVRLNNKAFWVAFIPALLLLVQAGAAIFGITLDLSAFGDKLLDAANALFCVLAIVGVVNDPTTDGLSDSAQAMTYENPKK